jgi:hypothetical protein
LIADRSLQADLIAADGIDRFLESGEVDQGEMIDVATDHVLHGPGQGGRAIQRATTLERVVETVLATVLTDVVDEEVSGEGQQSGAGSVLGANQHHDHIRSLPTELAEPLHAGQVVTGIRPDQENDLHVLRGVDFDLPLRGGASGRVRLGLGDRFLLGLDADPIHVVPGGHRKDCSHEKEQSKDDGTTD